jgi:hypothetical protein
MGAVEKRKIFGASLESNPDFPFGYLEASSLY